MKPTPEDKIEEPANEIVRLGQKAENKGITPVSELTPEQRAIAEAIMGDLDAKPILEYGTEGEKSIQELIELLNAFENRYDLPTLFALKAEEIQNHPLREPAKKALNPMTALLSKIETDYSISREVYRDLRKRFRKISNAVGILNRDPATGKFTLDHDRVND